MADLFAKSNATFSPCGKYRYTLLREWDASRPAVAFLMLNPSTADAEQDDPTIRRCVGFARQWGAGGLVVVNLFALRSTDPDALYTSSFPVAPFDNRCAANDLAILAATEGRRVIAAWGCHGAHLDRGRAVMRLLVGRSVECLGTTKEGHPKHPLYLAARTVPIPYAPTQPEEK